jgi:Uma2 family endonuclease
MVAGARPARRTRIVYAEAMQTATSPESQASPTRRATVDDWLAIPEERRAELIHGWIVYHALPTLKHGAAQGEVYTQLRPYRQRRQGPGGPPGGWWMSQEVDMVLGDVGCRPDVVGWRREKHARAPEPNEQGVVTDEPDFVCEVLSPFTARYDQGAKRDAYFKAGVSHYWLVDPTYKTLTVLERGDRGYVILHVAGPEDTVRAAPFDGVEIAVGELFLDEGGEAEAEPQGT